MSKLYRKRIESMLDSLSRISGLYFRWRVQKKKIKNMFL